VNIPTIKIQEIVGYYPVLKEFPCKDGELCPRDLAFLLAIAKRAQAKHVLEIGTYNGRTTLELAKLDSVVSVETVDLPDEPVLDESHDDHHLIAKREVGSAYLGHPEARKITQYRMDSKQLSHWPGLPHLDRDLFWIDGAHTYGACKWDSETCLGMASHTKGTIVWHDCDPTHQGVVKAIECLRQSQAHIERYGPMDIRVIEETSLAYLKL